MTKAPASPRLVPYLPVALLALCLVPTWSAAALPAAVIAPPATQPATRPSNGWDAATFVYTKPANLIVEESTPTPAQIRVFPRPPQEAADAPDPKPPAGPVAPRVFRLSNTSFNIVHLRFRDTFGQVVPALLCTPKDQKGPFPLVIATHGLSSHKAQVIAQVGPTLLARGIAVLAMDLPCHGERPGEPLQIFARDKVAANHRQAVTDLRQLMDIALARPDIDPKPGVVLVGYSLGSWISSVTGPTDDRVKALVLMVGGAMENPTTLQKDPKSAPMAPTLALPHFAPRPVFMLNAKEDLLVTPDMARRLFAAAAEPKQQTWYEGGHLLPPAAYEDAANWIANRLRPTPPAAPRAGR